MDVEGAVGGAVAETDAVVDDLHRGVEEVFGDEAPGGWLGRGLKDAGAGRDSDARGIPDREDSCGRATDRGGRIGRSVIRRKERQRRREGEERGEELAGSACRAALHDAANEQRSCHASRESPGAEFIGFSLWARPPLTWLRRCGSAETDARAARECRRRSPLFLFVQRPNLALDRPVVNDESSSSTASVEVLYMDGKNLPDRKSH